MSLHTNNWSTPWKRKSWQLAPLCVIQERSLTWPIMETVSPEHLQIIIFGFIKLFLHHLISHNSHALIDFWYFQDIVDVVFERSALSDLYKLETEVKSFAGVMEVGIFISLASKVYFASADGFVYEKTVYFLNCIPQFNCGINIACYHTACCKSSNPEGVIG